MDEELELLKKRIAELDRLCYDRDIPEQTNFLTLQEQDLYLQMKHELTGVSSFLWGGYPGAERKCLFFLPSYLSGDAETVLSPSFTGADCENEADILQLFPLSWLCIRPKAEKFADELTHRDFLGAIMSLGIERARTGDLRLDGKSAYVACVPDIAPYLAENLISVRHTAVLCQITECPAHLTTPQLEEHTASVASLRVDSVIAAVFRLSRQGAQNAVSAGYVFVNGRQVLSADRLLKEDDIVSLRHQGKFICRGQAARSRKGRCIVRYDLYL